MIVVLDTNVVISALLSPTGPPAEIIRRWEAAEFEVATSVPLIVELERVLNYPQVNKFLKLSQEEVTVFLNHMRIAADVVKPQVTVDVIKKDPTDNRLLECALAGGASYIISGDSHLLELKEHTQIVILDPSSFLKLLDHQFL